MENKSLVTREVTSLKKPATASWYPALELVKSKSWIAGSRSRCWTSWGTEILHVEARMANLQIPTRHKCKGRAWKCKCKCPAAATWAFTQMKGKSRFTLPYAIMHIMNTGGCQSKLKISSENNLRIASKSSSLTSSRKRVMLRKVENWEEPSPKSNSPQYQYQ